MSRTSLLGIATALATAATVALTASPAAASAACDPALVAPAGSLIGGLWRDNGGERSVYGCPITKEYGFAGKRGSYQEFKNGRIVWSPNLGEGALIRGYQVGSKVVMRWSGLGRDWDFFNVRWTKGSEPWRQIKVARITPWSGAVSVRPFLTGDGVESTSGGHQIVRVRFHVQGCDRGFLSSDCGPWSIANSVRFAH